MDAEEKPKKPSRKPREVPCASGLELVAVAWEDANLSWQDEATSTIQGDVVINVTAGFLLRHNRRLTELVVDVTPSLDSVRSIYTIPTRLVRKIHRTGFHAGELEPTQ